MISWAFLAVAISATPYDTSSWDLFPGSIPRINSTSGVAAGIPVVSGGGIVTGPLQVSGVVWNLLSRSEAIVSVNSLVSPWTNQNLGGAGSITYSTVSTVAPSGSVENIARFQVPAATSSQRSVAYNGITTVIGTSYTWSAWLKAGDASNRVLHICLHNGSSPIAASVVDCALTDSWQRCYGSGTASGTTTYLMIGNVGLDLPASDALVFEVQVEPVGNLSTPGPYVSTVAAAASGVRGEYNGQPSDPGILVPVQISDPRTWGVGLSASKASWAEADALVDIGGQTSGYRWNSARLETTAAGALVFTVIDSTGASATRTVAAHNFSNGSTHKLAFGAFDGAPFLLVDGVASGTLSGTAVLSSFPSTIGINSTVHPVAKTVYRVSQGPTPWAAHRKLK